MATLNTLEDRTDLSGEKMESLLGVKENIMKSSTRASSPTKEQSKEKDATKAWSKKDVARQKPKRSAVLPMEVMALGFPLALPPALALALSLAPCSSSSPALLVLLSTNKTTAHVSTPNQATQRDEKERKKGALPLNPPKHTLGGSPGM